MCGIAGIIHRNGSSPIGDEMTRMLQAMKHRGPDSTGFALYGAPSEEWVMRVKLADSNTPRDFDFAERLAHNRGEVERRMHALGARFDATQDLTPYAFDIRFAFDNGDLKTLVDQVEDVSRDAEVLSLGHSLEIVKDLGDAETVSREYGLDRFQGTHAIGHARMATESDVDISNAHPYWAYPFSDVAVVHNGHLERNGHRFQSECDSEIIAVYLAERMHDGLSLEDAMHKSMEELDGVFTYICVTEDALGMAKDELAAKPLVLYESDDVVVLASEEIAIRRVIPREIDTYDPFEGAVMVWTR